MRFSQVSDHSTSCEPGGEGAISCCTNPPRAGQSTSSESCTTASSLAGMSQMICRHDDRYARTNDGQFDTHLTPNDAILVEFRRLKRRVRSGKDTKIEFIRTMATGGEWQEMPPAIVCSSAGSRFESEGARAGRNLLPVWKSRLLAPRQSKPVIASDALPRRYLLTRRLGVRLQTNLIYCPREEDQRRGRRGSGGARQCRLGYAVAARNDPALARRSRRAGPQATTHRPTEAWRIRRPG